MLKKMRWCHGVDVLDVGLQMGCMLSFTIQQVRIPNDGTCQFKNCITNIILEDANHRENESEKTDRIEILFKKARELKRLLPYIQAGKRRLKKTQLNIQSKLIFEILCI